MLGTYSNKIRDRSFPFFLCINANACRRAIDCDPPCLLFLFVRFPVKPPVPRSYHANTLVHVHRPSTHSFFRVPLTANFVRESHNSCAREARALVTAINPDLSFRDKLTCCVVSRCIYAAYMMIITFPPSFACLAIAEIKDNFFKILQIDPSLYDAKLSQTILNWFWLDKFADWRNRLYRVAPSGNLLR